MMYRLRWQLLAVVFAMGCSTAGPTMANPGQAQSLGATPAVVSPRHGKKTVRMAVLPLANNSDRDGLNRAGGSLAEIASSELLNQPGIVLIERQRLKDVLSELRLGPSGVVDGATAAKVGRMVGANYMAFGSFSNLGGRWLLSMRIVRVETGEIVSAVTEHSADERALEELAKKAIRETVSSILPLAPGHPELDKSVLSDDSDIVIPKGQARANAIAVIIGVRDYKSKDVPSAEYALDDAALVRRFVTQGLGFSSDNVIYAADPTKAELEAIFGTNEDFRGKIWRRIGLLDSTKTELFIYYSGHGAPGLKDKHAYLVPADANPNYVELNGYPRDLMLANLAKLGARRTAVVLETCFSGNSDSGVLIKQASPLLLISPEATRPQGIDLFTSASSDEISSWYPEKRHSLFTYFFVREMAKAVGNPQDVGSRDKLAGQIIQAVSTCASQKYDRNQTPEFWGDATKILQ